MRFSRRTQAMTCVESVRCRPPAYQPGGLEPLEHQAQQRIGSSWLGQPGAELTQHRGVKAGVVQVQSQGVLPGDPVRECLRGLAVGEIVQELQDRHHQQQCRGEPGLAEPGVHVLKLTGGEVLILKQRAQRVPDPHLVGPVWMHPAGQRRGCRRNLWNTRGP
jgi:hypothetical protein